MSIEDDSKTDAAVLASLNNRTLVNGALVPTAPIGPELGLSADQLEKSLASLASRGFILRDGADKATMLPKGHATSTI